MVLTQNMTQQRMFLIKFGNLKSWTFESNFNSVQAGFGLQETDYFVQ